MLDILRLMRYVNPYKRYIAIALLSMSVQVFVSFFIPYLMIDIIDVALPARDFDVIVNLSIVMLVLALLGIISGVINAYTSQYIAQYASAELRLDVFRRIQDLSFSNIDTFKQSRLITNATNDVLRVQMFFTMMLRILVRAPLMIVMGFALALGTSLRLSQVFYITVPMLIITVALIMYYAYPRFKKVQHALDDLNNVTLENANAPQVVKSFVSQPYEHERFETTNEQYRQANTGAETVMAFAEPTINFIFNLGVAMILFFGAFFMTRGEFIGDTGVPQVGVLMAFNTYSQQILVGLMMFAMTMVFLSRANVSAARVNEVFNAEVDLVNPKDPVKREISGRIDFDSVSFGYGHGDAIRDIDLSVESGEKLGIIGSTGSGKSTLVQLIPRLYDAREGTLQIDGVPVEHYDLTTLRDQIGFVTQHATIFSGSVATNIRQGLEDADYETLESVSEKALLDEFVKADDEHFNKLVHSKGSNLSGGQKQRLSIARALIKQPSILILDDATSAVDAKSERRLLSHIDDLEYDPTVLLISQKVSTVRRMDRIAVLDDEGRIDGVGTHGTLLGQSPVYREIARTQGVGGDDDA